MQLPRDTIIDRAKLVQYLLVPRLTDDKSRYLASAGFTQSNPNQLEDAIRQLASIAETHEDGVNEYGIFWRMAVSQFQRVALTRDVVEHRLCAGDVAYVVEVVPHPSGGETGCVLEVFNALGESIAVVAMPLSAVEPLAADEVFAVRRLNSWDTSDSLDC